MRYPAVFVVSTMLFLSEAAIPSAQGSGSYQPQNSAQEKAASLRLQLSEVEAKQAELQTRLRELEEDLKPENIEHSLAGVGSTHPEELREQRRRQLEIARKGIESQLEVLAAGRTRLDAAVARADTESYGESARGPGSGQARKYNAAAAGDG